MNFQFLGIRPEEELANGHSLPIPQVNEWQVRKQKMNAQAVAWFNANQSKLESSQRAIIQKKCSEMSDDKAMMLSQVKLKSPIVAFLVSFFLGFLGLDRFLIGEVGTGLLKFFTFGVFGILTIIDWFTIMGKVRKLNTQKILPYL